MMKRCADDPAILQAVRLAAMILAPSHFVRVLRQVATANAMVDTVLRPAQAAKEALGLIGVGAILGDIFDAMIDAAGFVGAVKRIPAARFVGANDRAGGDALADKRDRGALARHHKRQRAPQDLASHNDHLPLAGPFLREAPVGALGLLVFRLPMASRIETIYLHLANQLGAAVNVRAKRFAQLMAEHESRLVLEIEVAAQVERGVPLRTIRKDRDGEQIGADRQLAAGEQRSASQAELLVTRLALPGAALRDRPNRQATALRAKRLARVL